MVSLPKKHGVARRVSIAVAHCAITYDLHAGLTPEYQSVVTFTAIGHDENGSVVECILEFDATMALNMLSKTEPLLRKLLIDAGVI